MVLDKLGDSLRATLKKVTKAVFVDEKLVNELVKDIQRSLLQADVNVQLVFKLSSKIKTRALDEKPPAGVSPKEFLIKVVYEELVSFLGGEGAKISIKKNPFVIMLVGLFGSGKTTTCAKLAHFYKNRGQKVGLLTTDTWRPAAFDQLEQLSKQINVPMFGDKKAKHPVDIIKKFWKELQQFDIIIVDTAGRDALSDELIKELDAINKEIIADERLLVLSADIGQAAENQAKAFHDSGTITGVVITKLDGTAKGGGSLIACSVTGANVKFIGVGEKIDDLEEFKPEGFVGRLLGMGDLEALLEKAKGVMTEEEAEDMGRKFLKGEFNLIDLYDQMNSMKKMGPLSKVAKLIPGFSDLNVPKDMLQLQEGKLEKWRYLMDSMTKEELENPEDITGGRIERISRGSGLEMPELRSLLKQYKQSKKLFKMMKGNENNMGKMMQRMQKGGMGKMGIR
ncbi:MAG: signal recognition particle protein Srp54 [Nanoarchaeota archaeon]|nr:signal recognition particle protein Srp54 [Nanoarchaeota archaeon]